MQGGDRLHIRTGVKPCVNLLYLCSNEHAPIDSHQLLCSWNVEVNSESFPFARFTRGFYTHLELFGGSKMVRFDWLLDSQSGCCRFDPF